MIACTQGQAVVRPVERNDGAVGQGAQDILEFFGVGGDAEVACLYLPGRRVDLDFQSVARSLV